MKSLIFIKIFFEIKLFPLVVHLKEISVILDACSPEWEMMVTYSFLDDAPNWQGVKIEWQAIKKAEGE